MRHGRLITNPSSFLHRIDHIFGHTAAGILGVLFLRSDIVLIILERLDGDFLRHIIKREQVLNHLWGKSVLDCNAVINTEHSFLLLLFAAVFAGCCSVFSDLFLDGV